MRTPLYCVIDALIRTVSPNFDMVLYWQETSSTGPL